MDATPGERTVAVVTACLQRNGLPIFVLNEVCVTAEEEANGALVVLAEERLLAEGYEEPFVHFPESEAPAFLHPAVRLTRDHPAPVPILVLAQEDGQTCVS